MKLQTPERLAESVQRLGVRWPPLRGPGAAIEPVGAGAPKAIEGAEAPTAEPVQRLGAGAPTAEPL